MDGVGDLIVEGLEFELDELLGGGVVCLLLFVGVRLLAIVGMDLLGMVLVVG